MGKLLGASLAFFGIGVFVLPAGIVASGFAEEVKYGIEPPKEPILNINEVKHDSSSIVQDEFITQYQQVQEDAKLLKHCLQVAQQEFNELEDSQEAIHSWAMLLYVQLKNGNNIKTGQES